MVAAPAHIGDAGIGVEHLERLGTHLLEVVTTESGDRGLVVCAHPGQRVVAGDVLEPQIRIVFHTPILAWRSSAQVVDLLQPVDRGGDALVAGLQLQREIQRVVP